MTWVAVGISAVGAISSIAGGISGKKAAEKAGKFQAKIIEQTAAENRRRRELDLQHQLGGVTAAVAASNLQMTGSSRRYRNVFESNYRAEMAWDKQKAMLDARAAKKGGAAVGKAAMFAGVTGSIGSFATGFSVIAAHGAANPSGSGNPFYFGSKEGEG